MIGKYEKALKQGREIVVVSNDENYNSAVFSCDRDNNIWCYSVPMGGEFKRDDLTFPDLEKHLENMEADSMVFVRGWR